MFDGIERRLGSVPRALLGLGRYRIMVLQLTTPARWVMLAPDKIVGSGQVVSDESKFRL